MDLMLVMNERMRNQTLEQRAALARLTVLTLVGILLFCVGLYTYGTSPSTGPAGVIVGASGSGKMEVTSASGTMLAAHAAHSNAPAATAAVAFVLGNVALLGALHFSYPRSGPWWPRASTPTATTVSGIFFPNSGPGAYWLPGAYYAVAAATLVMIYAGVSTALLAACLVLQAALFVSRSSAQRRALLMGGGPSTYGGPTNQA